MFSFISNRQRLSVALLSLLLLSCGESKQSDFCAYEIPSDVPMIEVSEWDFNLTDFFNNENALLRFSDFFSKIEYVKLESAEGYSIGNISKIEITEKGDYIIFDRDNGTIVRFNSAGHFLNPIGMRGKSSAEYLHPQDVVYDRYRCEVVVCDRSKGSSLKFYDINGNFLRKLQFDTYFSTFNLIGKDYIVIFMNYGGGRLAEGETAYNYRVFDRSGELVKEYEPYQSDRNFFHTVESHTFSNQNGRLICNERYHPLIFTLDENVATPLWYIDFGKKKVPTDILLHCKTSRDWHNWEKENDVVFCKQFYETKNYFLMQLIEHHGEIVFYLQDKRTKQEFAKRYGFNDINGIVSKNAFDHFYEEKIYYVYDPSEIQWFIDAISNKRDEMEKRCGKIEQKDIDFLTDLVNHTNPILQICTLK